MKLNVSDMRIIIFEISLDNMKKFNVLLFNFNRKEEVKLDIMPYLLDTYHECQANGFWWPLEDPDSEPKAYSDYVSFVKHVCMHRYWSRCEYEWLMIGWPPGNTDTLEGCQKILDESRKIDAWKQIEMNFELVVDIFIENLKLDKH